MALHLNFKFLTTHLSNIAFFNINIFSHTASAHSLPRCTHSHLLGREQADAKYFQKYPEENPGENPIKNPGTNPGINPGFNPAINPEEYPEENPGTNPEHLLAPDQEGDCACT